MFQREPSAVPEGFLQSQQLGRLSRVSQVHQETKWCVWCTELSLELHTRCLCIEGVAVFTEENYKDMRFGLTKATWRTPNPWDVETKPAG